MAFSYPLCYIFLCISSLPQECPPPTVMTTLGVNIHILHWVMRQHAIEHPLYVRVVSTLVYRLYMYLLCYVFSCIIFPCRYANHGWSRLSIYHSGHGLVCSTRVRIRVVSYTTTISLSVAASHAFAKPCEPHPLCTTVVCCTLFTSLDVHFINVYLSYSKHWLPIATCVDFGSPPT